MDSQTTQAPTLPPDSPGRYAAVNGLHLYYEVHGTGRPLILLHGGLGGVIHFGAVLPALAATRQVIAVELQGHMHTTDREGPLRFEQMADDVAALIAHLGLDSVDLLGYSLGGGVAQQTAIRHPERVRKLVLISAPCRRQGWYEEVLAGMAAMSAEAAKGMMASPIYAAYAAAAPDVANWPVLVEKTGELLRREYDWSEQITALVAPILIIIGDADSVRITAAVELFALRGGGLPRDMMGGQRPPSQLAILPDTTHFSIIERADLLLPIIGPFLDAPASQNEA